MIKKKAEQKMHWELNIQMSPLNNKSPIVVMQPGTKNYFLKLMK